MVKTELTLEDVRRRFASSYTSNQEGRAVEFDQLIQTLIASNIAQAKEQWMADDETVQEAVEKALADRDYDESIAARVASWYED